MVRLELLRGAESRPGLEAHSALCTELVAAGTMARQRGMNFRSGGNTLTPANIRLLCAKHVLEKSDKIIPWVA